MKRFLDLIISFFSLVILTPIFLPVIIILRFTGEGEIFYIQQRVGREGKLFGLYKFATMMKNSPNIGSGEITVRGDPRVLPFGKYLRKTKLNELPQLWNVFIGDMSLVGPRPMVLNTYAYYPEEVRNKLDTVRPGLTGIGSIIFRDEEHFLADCDEPMEFYKEYIIPYKNDLELWFLKNDTLWLYLKIILVTVYVVIFPSNIIVRSAFKGMPKAPNNLLQDHEKL